MRSHLRAHHQAQARAQGFDFDSLWEDLPEEDMGAFNQFGAAESPHVDPHQAAQEAHRKAQEIHRRTQEQIRAAQHTVTHRGGTVTHQVGGHTVTHHGGKTWQPSNNNEQRAMTTAMP
eukprot:m.97564 g.97564  ORF g.97564 m.97564 type:complete len:118 (+) comp22049_c0_seq4:258-611(+)